MKQSCRLSLSSGRHFIYVRAHWTDNGMDGRDDMVWASPVYLY